MKQSRSPSQPPGIPKKRISSHQQWIKTRNRYFAIMFGLLSAAGYFIYDAWNTSSPVPAVQKDKMSFDDFLKYSFREPSEEEKIFLTALYQRAQDEFSVLELSSEMRQQFCTSYARMLRGQHRVYEKRLDVNDFLNNAHLLLEKKVQFASRRYPARPQQKLRHVWIPDSVDDSE